MTPRVVDCPNCGTEMTHDEHGYYECQGCFSSFTDKDYSSDRPRHWCLKCQEFVDVFGGGCEQCGEPFVNSPETGWCSECGMEVPVSVDVTDTTRCSECFTIITSKECPTLTCKCPKCEFEVDMMVHKSGSGVLYQCPECNMGFLPDELALQGVESMEEDTESVYYGECRHCAKAAIFEWDESSASYFCSECGTMGLLSEMVADTWDVVVAESGWLCCPFCDEPVKGLVGNDSEMEFHEMACLSCSRQFRTRMALKSTCPHCHSSSPKPPNVIHLGDTQVKQRFLCLDCNRDFMKDMKQCPSCGVLAKISPTSVYGLLYHCWVCNKEFSDRSSFQDTSTTSDSYGITRRRAGFRHSGWDDDDWYYLSRPKKSLEQLVAEQFVLEMDL